MKKIETYIEMKNRHQNEINSFEGLFFAFSNEQFKEGIAKIGFTMADTSKICSIGAGGYMLREKVKDFVSLMNSHQTERKQLKADNKKLLEALIYELNNHEFCLTGDLKDTLNSLDLLEADIPVEILAKAVNECRAED